ncbi:MAG: nuclease-related domain-containing protein [Pseudomonadota bacterium]
MNGNSSHQYHVHLGIIWPIFCFIAITLAIKELLSIFGMGLIIQPAIGIVVGSITSLYLLVSFTFRERKDLKAGSFAPIEADDQCRAEVAGFLKNIPSPYFSFNSIVFKGLVIDHVVLSPQGCLTIHTRGLLGRIFGSESQLQIDGRNADALLSECWYEAHYLQEQLQREFRRDVDVFPVLCLPRIAIQEPFISKGVVVTDFNCLKRVIDGYSDEIIGRSFFLVLSGFLAKAEAGRTRT